LASSLASDSPFTAVTSSIDENGNHVFSFTMDATSIIEHSDGADWTGVAFDESVGIWLHPMTDVQSSYGEDGYLDSWSIGGQGWFDTSNQTAVKEIIEVPVASADYLVGNDGADEIHGEQGNDVIFGDNDDGSAVEDPALAGDYITGGSGDDTIFGQQGDDVIYGDGGPNMMVPTSGSAGGEGEGGSEPVAVTFTLSDPSYSDDPLGEYSHGGDGYASGSIEGDDMVVTIGGIDDHDICDMAGGYTTNFTVEGGATGTTVSFDYRMVMSENYESNEFGEVWVAINGERVEIDGNAFVSRVHGDGNGGSPYDSGWQTVTIDVGDLPAGDHTITLGGYNNTKTYHDEELEVRFTDLQVTGMVGGEIGGAEETGGSDAGVNAIFHFELEDTTWGSNETVTDGVNGMTGTAKGGTGSTSGAEGDAAQFDGSGDYIEVPHDASMETTTGTFTADFVAWNNGTIASKDSKNYDDGGHFDIDINSDREVVVRIQTDDSSITLEGGDVDWNNWHNVTVTWDGDTVALYVNGEEVDSVQSDWNMASNQNPWTFAASQTSSGDDVADNLKDYLNGKIDNPALFDGALTADQVSDMVSGGVTDFVSNLGSTGEETVTVDGEGGVEFMLGGMDVAASDYDVDTLWNKTVDGYEITVTPYSNLANGTEGEFGFENDGNVTRGIGVRGGDQEVNMPEGIKVDFGGMDLTEVTVGLRALFIENQPADGVETGTWIAYKDGQQVGTGTVDAVPGADDGKVAFDIAVDGGFDALVFTSTEHGSDFHLEYIQGVTPDDAPVDAKDLSYNDDIHGGYRRRRDPRPARRRSAARRLRRRPRRGRLRQ
jgi:hypothetical protein